jgi:hypothetical protein
MASVLAQIYNIGFLQLESILVAINAIAMNSVYIHTFVVISFANLTGYDATYPQNTSFMIHTSTSNMLIH